MTKPMMTMNKKKKWDLEYHLNMENYDFRPDLWKTSIKVYQEGIDAATSLYW